jgi:Flp pilus assembly protein TadG
MNLAYDESNRNHGSGDRRGTSTVEFAMTAPILFLILFASLEFSRYQMIQQMAANAAFEATRKCILPGYSSTDGQTAGQNLLSQAFIKDGVISIYDADTGTAISGSISLTTEKIRVTVKVPVASNLWVRPLYLGSGTITKSCTLTRDWVNAGHS